MRIIKIKVLFKHLLDMSAPFDLHDNASQAVWCAAVHRSG